MKLYNYKEFGENPLLNERFSLQGRSAVWAYAHAICLAYDKLPVFDPTAVKHWDSLLASSEKFYKEMMSHIKIIVSPHEVYKDCSDMVKRVNAEKIMYVSAEYTNHPLWSDGQYQTFRAVHDYIVHVEGHTDFSLKGELRATELHSRLVPAMARPAVFLEIAGKVCSYYIQKDWAPQKVAVLKGFDIVNIGIINTENNYVEPTEAEKLEKK